MDPRIARLVERFAYARGRRMLGRGKDQLPTSEELAGWALERTGHDPLKAIGVLAKIAMPTAQRVGATRLLRPLLTSIEIKSRT